MMAVWTGREAWKVVRGRFWIYFKCKADRIYNKLIVECEGKRN